MSRFGVDIGGTTVKIGIVSDAGEILEKQIFDTRNERTISEIVKEIALNIIRMAKGDLSYIGVGAPSFFNFPNIDRSSSWHKELARYFPNIEMSVHNDAECACWAEYKLGAGIGYDNMIMLTLGTGVGGGVIIDGKLLDKPCELGHIIVCNDGKQCTCGRKGCLEAYASANAYNNAKNKDDFNKYMSQSIVSLTNIFETEAFIIGGGLANIGESLLEPIRELVKENFKNRSNAPQILLAEVADSGIIGAIML